MRGIGYCPPGCMNVCYRPVMNQAALVNNQVMYQNQQAAMMQ